MNDVYDAADAIWQAGGSGQAAGPWPADAVGERVTPPLAAAPGPAVVPVGSRSRVRRPPRGRSDGTADNAMPLRLVQVYLTPGIDEFLRQARCMAIMQNLDVTASAVVRHAMERLMATVSPAEMVDLLGSPKGQSQLRRGRPRR